MKFDRAIREEIKDETSSGIRLELEGGDNKNNAFSPGDTIRGKITIEDSKILPKIRKAELVLGAIEFVQSKGKNKRTEIFPKYKKKIQWNKGDDNNSVIPFETHIPKDIRRSYLGEYSEYYWLFEAKIDIPRSGDLYARTIVEIV